jgi:hypothetical protein
VAWKGLKIPQWWERSSGTRKGEVLLPKVIKQYTSGGNSRAPVGPWQDHQKVWRAECTQCLCRLTGGIFVYYGESRAVPAHPSTTAVEQPSSLLCIRSAYTTFLHVRITARPIDPLVNSLFNRPQGEKYVMQPHEEVSDKSLYIPRGVSDFWGLAYLGVKYYRI